MIYDFSIYCHYIYIMIIFILEFSSRFSLCANNFNQCNPPFFFIPLFDSSYFSFKYFCSFPIRIYFAFFLNTEDFIKKHEVDIWTSLTAKEDSYLSLGKFTEQISLDSIGNSSNWPSTLIWATKNDSLCFFSWLPSDISTNKRK